MIIESFLPHNNVSWGLFSRNLGGRLRTYLQASLPGKRLMLLELKYPQGRYADQATWEEQAQRFCREHEGCTLDAFMRMLFNPKSEFGTLFAWEAAHEVLSCFCSLMRELSDSRVSLPCFQDPVFRAALHAMNRRALSGLRSLDFEFNMVKLVTLSHHPQDLQCDFELACASIVCVRGLSAFPVMLRYKIASFLDFSNCLGFLSPYFNPRTEDKDFLHVKRVFIDVFRGVMTTSSLDERVDLLFSVFRQYRLKISEASPDLIKETVIKMFCDASSSRKLACERPFSKVSEVFFLGIARSLHDFSEHEYPAHHPLVKALIERFQALMSTRNDHGNFDCQKMRALMDQYAKCLQVCSREKIAQFAGCFLATHFFHQLGAFLMDWAFEYGQDFQLQVFGKFTLKYHLKCWASLPPLSYQSPEKLKELFQRDNLLDRLVTTFKDDQQRLLTQEVSKIWSKLRAMF